jgi:hypothetical protein
MLWKGMVRKMTKGVDVHFKYKIGQKVWLVRGCLTGYWVAEAKILEQRVNETSIWYDCGDYCKESDLYETREEAEQYLKEVETHKNVIWLNRTLKELRDNWETLNKTLEQNVFGEEINLSLSQQLSEVSDKINEVNEWIENKAKERTW